ncbi:hypothetical protein SDC9_132771 [bioreactor metagenome]|uniref:Uncharacterized protein n=1 Tax=bioreactor metagenome TaxID=1076179 RepID=A0A645D844_9ZZZZ
MGLFDLVKEQNGVGVLLHKARECAGLCILIAGFKPHQPHIGLVIGKAGHIEALERNAECLRRLFRQEGFAYPGRACKHENGAGPLALFIRGGQHFRGKHAFRKGVNHVILPMDGGEKPGPHVPNAVCKRGKEIPAHFIRAFLLCAGCFCFARAGGLMLLHRLRLFYGANL